MYNFQNYSSHDSQNKNLTIECLEPKTARHRKQQESSPRTARLIPNNRIKAEIFKILDDLKRKYSLH